MSATILKRVSMAVGMSRVFWDTTSSNIGAMAHIATQLDPLRRLLQDQTNQTLYDMTTKVMAGQVRREEEEEEGGCRRERGGRKRGG